jgi:hypothetical protein
MENKISLSLIDNAVQSGNIAEASRLVKLAIKQQIDLKGRNIFYANVLLASMPWTEFSALLPAGTNSFQTTGWINSTLKARPLDANNNPIPWFTYPAIDFLESIIDPKWHIFEWGSGNSTKWWARKCASVVAVESNHAWHSEVSKSIPPNATAILAQDAASYTQAIHNYDKSHFDVIVVDGDHRNKCVESSIGSLKDDTIIVFDNSDRRDYKSGIQLLLDAGFYHIDFWGLIPSYAYRNCTSIFFLKPDLLKRAPLPSDHTSDLGLSCDQTIERLKGNK